VACGEDDKSAESDSTDVTAGSTSTSSSADTGGQAGDSSGDESAGATGSTEQAGGAAVADETPAGDTTSDDTVASDDSNASDDSSPSDDTPDPDQATGDDGTDAQGSDAAGGAGGTGGADDDTASDDSTDTTDAASGSGGAGGSSTIVDEPSGDDGSMDMGGAAEEPTDEMGMGGGANDTDSSTDSVQDDGTMSFFVTSVGGPDGGDLGGLEGADAFCTELAAAVSPELGAKPWRAYLSVVGEDARDRIGSGPWRNFNGDIIANDVQELHDQDMGALDATWPIADLGVALTETGEEVVNQVHDILTGTMADGTWDEARDCDGWTSNSSDLEATVGHSNRDGGGRPPYFNATHQVGCAPTTDNYENGTVSSGGGRGSIYCFAVVTQ
jgi:hypothetical protein